MKKKRPVIMIAGVLMVMLIFSCSTVKRTKPVVPIPEKFNNEEKSSESTLNLKRWWEEFNDPALNVLVEEAIKNNHDIRLAAERILQLEAELRAVNAVLYPRLDLQGNLTRQKQSVTSTFTGQRVSFHTTNINLSVVTSYEIDLWARLKASEKAKWAEYFKVKENRESILQTVVSELVNQYIQMQALKQKIAITSDSIKNARKTYQIIKGRYKRGLSSYLDLLQAQGFVTEQEALLPSLKRQLKEIKKRIALIVGRYPSDDVVSTKSGLIDIDTLRPVPAGLPSELLLRRPDIKALESEMEAAFQLLRAKRAARFPRITLTGTYGYTSDELRNLFKPENTLWQIASGVVVPLFDAGRLKAEEQAQASRYRQLQIQYSKSVLQAFFEVENALTNRLWLYKERDKLLRLYQDYKRALEAARNRYSRGIVDLLNVLELERRLFQTRQRLTDTTLSILKNRVFLYKALGGRWY